MAPRRQAREGELYHRHGWLRRPPRRGGRSTARTPALHDACRSLPLDPLLAKDADGVETQVTPQEEEAEEELSDPGGGVKGRPSSACRERCRLCGGMPMNSTVSRISSERIQRSVVAGCEIAFHLQPTDGDLQETACSPGIEGDAGVVIAIPPASRGGAPGRNRGSSRGPSSCGSAPRRERLARSQGGAELQLRAEGVPPGRRLISMRDDLPPQGFDHRARIGQRIAWRTVST